MKRALPFILVLFQLLHLSCSQKNEPNETSDDRPILEISDSLLLNAMYPSLEIITLDSLRPYVVYNSATNEIDHDSICSPFHAVLLDEATRAEEGLSPFANTIQVSNRFSLGDNLYLYLLHEDRGYGGHPVSSTIMVRFEMTSRGVNILQKEDSFPIGGAEWSNFTRDVKLLEFDEDNWLLEGWHSWGSQLSWRVFKLFKLIPKDRDNMVLNASKEDLRFTSYSEMFDYGIEEGDVCYLGYETHDTIYYRPTFRTDYTIDEEGSICLNAVGVYGSYSMQVIESNGEFGPHRMTLDFMQEHTDFPLLLEGCENARFYKYLIPLKVVDTIRYDGYEFEQDFANHIDEKFVR